MSRFGSALLALGLVVLGLVGLAACAKSSGESCELNSDCLGGYCRDGECTQDCVDSEKDCPKGYVCNSIGQCEYGGGPGGGGVGGAGNGGAGTGASGSGGDGGDGTTSTGTSTSTGTTTGSGGGGSGAALLTPCNFDTDCASGLCRPTMVNGDKRCTESCAALSDCGSGLRCETIGSESYCAFSDVGRDCTGVGQCNFACLSPLNYCTSLCASGADCPNGYGCMEVTGTNVCVRVAADCAADTTQCVAPAACDSSPNLVVSSCTIACNGPQDCPQRAAGLPAWSCDGLCRRPGDVYGPLPVGYSPTQYACNASSAVVNVCNDGLQIDFDTFTQPLPPAVNCGSPTTTDGVPGDSCLDSCRFRGGCDYGYGCVALASLDSVQAIGLCMPRGLGQVGASCTKHGDCAFALCDNGVCSRDCSKDGLCPEGSTCTATGDLPVEGSMNRHCL